MFDSATLFNQDISSWDVISVTKMNGMFSNTTTFNQDISSWDVTSVLQCGNFSFNASAWILPKPNFTNCTEYVAFIYNFKDASFI